MTDSLRERCDVRQVDVFGQTVHVLAPRRGRSAWYFIYTYGGAFVNPLDRTHWNIIDALISSTGAAAIVPLYPLAPEHHYREAFRQLEAVYRALIGTVSPRQIVLCGDAAGANLALGQAIHYRDRGLRLPSQIILFSPWLDLTLANPVSKTLEGKDVAQRVEPLRQAGRWWAGSTDPRAPLLSPLYANLRGLPPIQLYVGTHDIFLPDARSFRDRVVVARGRIRHDETPGGFPVFMKATFTPEARRVYRQIAQTLERGPVRTAQR
jgi:acetyl esterase/lipase